MLQLLCYFTILLFKFIQTALDFVDWNADGRKFIVLYRTGSATAEVYCFLIAGILDRYAMVLKYFTVKYSLDLDD